MAVSTPIPPPTFSDSAAAWPEQAGLRRVLLIAAAFVILASPTWLQLWFGRFSAFPAVSLVYLVAVAALVAFWGRLDPSPPPARINVLAIAAGGVALLLIAVAAGRFVDNVLQNPPDPRRGDMLTVIEQAGRRFVRGRNPYGVYHLPWDVSLPYGPPLWAPFIAPEMLRIDLRLLTTAGLLFVPLCCGAVALLAAARNRPGAAGAWLVLLAVMVFDPDLRRFVSVGHTPAYWPLLPLLAMFIVGANWYGAAVVLGILVAGRATMVAMVPVFVMAVWFRDRARARGAVVVCAGVIVAILLPFFLWDPGAMWRGMITNYVAGIKAIVWHSSDQGAIRTIGLTGWLLSHGLDDFVDPSLLLVLAVVYPIAWFALRRGVSPLPLMALALFAFSMATVWPVYYVHFDVVLLLASAAIAETAGALSQRSVLAAWTALAATAAGLVAVAVVLIASPLPSVVIAQPSGRQFLRQGFAGIEDDGARRFSWIEAGQAVLLLPRSSASDAVVVVTGQPFVPAGGAPLAVTAILNDVPLGTQQAGGGWQTLRFQAPAAAWRIGANHLELQFPPTASPKELGLSDDPRHLAMAIQRIDVEPR